MSESNNNSSGVGFVGLLTILFIGLKLSGLITWSWWWVLSPLLIGVLVLFLCVLMWLGLRLAGVR